MPSFAESSQSGSSRAIRLHLVSRDSTVTVCIRAADGTCWSEARGALRSCGVVVPDRLYVGSQALDETTTLGRHPLLNGAQLCTAPTAPDTSHLLAVVITEGPAVGARSGLGAQVQRIGRARSSSLALRDPGLSRTHLVVGVDQGRAMVSDAGSTNGSYIDGRRLAPEEPVELRAGQRLRAGSTTVALERSLPTDEPATTDDSCRIPFQRAPGSLPTSPRRLWNDPRHRALRNDTGSPGR